MEVEKKVWIESPTYGNGKDPYQYQRSASCIIPGMECLRQVATYCISGFSVVCEGPVKLLQISKSVPKTLLQVQWLQWPSGAGHGLEKVLIPAYRGSGVDAAV